MGSEGPKLWLFESRRTDWNRCLVQFGGSQFSDPVAKEVFAMDCFFFVPNKSATEIFDALWGLCLRMYFFNLRPQERMLLIHVSMWGFLQMGLPQ